MIVRKLREKGIKYCAEATLWIVYSKINAFMPVRFINNLLNLLMPRKHSKVILGIWDYKLVPWSIGDFLGFIETLSVLKIKHNADKVDVCVVCDSEHPTGIRSYQDINSSNFRDKLFDMLPIISICPYLGSVLQFDSRQEFYSFLKRSINKYEIYPPIRQQLAETYNFYGGATFKEIQEFYEEYRYIPQLTIGDNHLNWAYELLYTKAKGMCPVAVSLRWNPGVAVHRNADRGVWLEFFNLCQIEFPNVMFIVVGSRGEVFEELRHCPNIIVAKDYGSTLLDDFALIRLSLLYMGIESGVADFAIFSDVPYLLFGREEIARKALNLSLISNFAFATPYQRVYYAESFTITPQSLLKEFSSLYYQLSTEKWQEKKVVHANHV